MTGNAICQDCKGALSDEERSFGASHCTPCARVRTQQAVEAEERKASQKSENRPDLRGLLTQGPHLLPPSPAWFTTETPPFYNDLLAETGVVFLTEEQLVFIPNNKSLEPRAWVANKHTSFVWEALPYKLHVLGENVSVLLVLPLLPLTLLLNLVTLVFILRFSRKSSLGILVQGGTIQTPVADELVQRLAHRHPADVQENRERRSRGPESEGEFAVIQEIVRLGGRYRLNPNSTRNVFITSEEILHRPSRSVLFRAGDGGLLLSESETPEGSLVYYTVDNNLFRNSEQRRAVQQYIDLVCDENRSRFAEEVWEEVVGGGVLEFGAFSIRSRTLLSGGTRGAGAPAFDISEIVGCSYRPADRDTDLLLARLGADNDVRWVVAAERLSKRLRQAGQALSVLDRISTENARKVVRSLPDEGLSLGECVLSRERLRIHSKKRPPVDVAIQSILACRPLAGYGLVLEYEKDGKGREQMRLNDVPYHIIQASIAEFGRVTS